MYDSRCSRTRSHRPHVAAVLAALTLAAGAPARAADAIPANELRQGLYSTCFANNKEGWAVGDLGRIFHTTDGANTWEIQSAGTKRPFVSVSCLDNKNAWIAGQAGQIARTSDGGKTWKELKSGTEKQILAIKMLNAKVGIAVGDFGTLLRTEDAGETWTKVSIPTDVKLPEEMEGIVEPGDIVLYTVASVGEDFVAIAGEFGVALISTDGGKSFRFSASGVETTLFGAFFADPQHGWLVGMDAVLLETHDGGGTWQKVAITTPPGFSLALFDLEVRGSLGWAVGNSGYLLTSKDAGVTWELVHVPEQMHSYWFREVSLLPDGKGYAVGSTGMVIAIDGNKYTALKKEL